jgi:hypothetical protein
MDNGFTTVVEIMTRLIEPPVNINFGDRGRSLRRRTNKNGRHSKVTAVVN